MGPGLLVAALHGTKSRSCQIAPGRGCDGVQVRPVLWRVGRVLDPLRRGTVAGWDVLLVCDTGFEGRLGGREDVGGSTCWPTEPFGLLVSPSAYCRVI